MYIYIYIYKYKDIDEYFDTLTNIFTNSALMTTRAHGSEERLRPVRVFLKMFVNIVVKMFANMFVNRRNGVGNDYPKQ